MTLKILGVLGAGLVVAVVLTGCRNAEKDTRRIVVEYFYGSGRVGGEMVRSWEGEERNDYILAKRAICGLDNSWVFFDENVDIVDLGDYEYFARYSVTFKKGDSMFRRIETSYFCGDTLWDAVPLTVQHLKMNLGSKSGKRLNYETLWRGDFDAFDERYRTHSKKSRRAD